MTMAWCFADESTPETAAIHAAYLDLGLRRQLPLASFDGELRRGVTSLGMQVLGK